MKLIFSVFLLITLKSFCYGQINTFSDKGPAVLNDLNYLYLIKMQSGKTIQTSNFVIANENIDSGSVLSRVEAFERFGILSRAGIVILKPKRGIKFVIINQMLNMFNIVIGDKLLPVYLDNKLITTPETLIADKSIINSVSIDTNLSTNEKYISIKTKNTRSSGEKASKPYLPRTFYFESREVHAIDSLLNVP